MGGHLSRIRRDHESLLRARDESVKCVPREDSSPVVADREATAVQPPSLPDCTAPRKDDCTWIEADGVCGCEVCTMVREAGSEYFEDCYESCFSDADSAYAEDETTAVQPPSIPKESEPSFETTVPETNQPTAEATRKGVLLDNFFEQTIELFRAGKKLEKTEPLKVKTFVELGFPSRLATNITIAGYSKPTLVQQFAMKSIQDGKDLMACCPTGVGRISSFLLPILSRILQEDVFCGMTKTPCMPRVLIVVPTHDLAIKIHQEAAKFSAGTFRTCDLLYGGSSFRYQQHRVVKGVSLLVGTVDRIKRFIIKGILCLKHTKHLVLCDANRLLDMGSLENLDFVLRNGKIPSKDKRQTLVFSTTTLPLYMQETVKSMKLMKEDHLMIVVEKVDKCVTQDFVRATRYTKKAKLMEMVGVDLEKVEQSSDLEIYKKKTLIFVSTNKMADMLGEFLSASGMVANIIHAEHDKAQREAAQDDFRKGTTPILIATEAAVRDLEISGIDHVINYDMPSEIDDYVYRIGRAGRLDKVGHSTSFIDPDLDGQIIDPLINLLMFRANQHVPVWFWDIRMAYFTSQSAEGDGGYQGSY